MDEKAIIVSVLPDSPENRAKKDKSDEYFTTCSSLSPAEVTVIFISDEIVKINFTGRPHHPHSSGGSNNAHINSVELIKEKIKNKYEGEAVDKIKEVKYKFSFSENLEKSDIEKKNYINRRKAIARKIANEFIDECKNPSNMYNSSSNHNDFLNHLLQKLKKICEDEKYPLSITLNEKYHDICAEKYPKLLDSTTNTLKIPNLMILKQIKNECQVDKPENNIEIKNKSSAYDFLASEEKNKPANPEYILDF